MNTKDLGLLHGNSHKEVRDHSYTKTGGGATGIIKDVSTIIQPCTSRKNVSL